SGRLSAPLNVVTRRFQARYTTDWKPIDVTIDATVRNQTFTLKSTVGAGTVTSEVMNGAEPANSTANVNADVLLPTPFYASYEALAARVKSAVRGSKLTAYFPPQAVFTIEVGESLVEHIQTTSQLIEARRTHLSMSAPNTLTMEFDLWADNTGRLLRLSVPQ